MFFIKYISLDLIFLMIIRNTNKIIFRKHTINYFTLQHNNLNFYKKIFLIKI